MVSEAFKWFIFNAHVLNQDFQNFLSNESFKLLPQRLINYIKPPNTTFSYLFTSIDSKRKLNYNKAF